MWVLTMVGLLVDGCVGLLLVFGGFAVLVVFDVCWLLIMDWLIVLIFLVL